MSKRSKTIASYRTKAGAERYARDLATAWPQYRFEPAPHPCDFTWAVIVRCGANFVSKAYVLKAKRAEFARLFTGQ